MLLLHEIRARLRRQGRRLEKLEARMPGRPEQRLESYRTDPSLLMTDSGFQPDGWQRDLLRSAAKRVLLLTCRQAGKSTAAGFLALKEAMLRPGVTVLLTAPSQRQSAELFRRAVDAFNRLGRPLTVANESVLRVEFGNRSQIISIPSVEATVRGYTAELVVLDEAARIGDSMVAAIRPMLAVSGGKLVCLSTAFAKSGFFYEQWSGPERWERVRVTAAMNPRISAEFLAEERRALGARWYAMEYECEFQDDVAAVFSSTDIAAAFGDPAVKPLFKVPAIPAAPPAVDPAVRPLFAAAAPTLGTAGSSR